ncbi:MAG: excinuclease ABC subunit C [Rickettsiales bacterium]|nr:excinuclease ABC subunit C [Rickettsiales bacterium]
MEFEIDTGIKSIKQSLIYCSRGPGIYQFLDQKKKILYIGKAKNIHNRVSSYLNFNGATRRIKKLISLIRHVKFIKTHTEVDALLLESNLVKKHRPIFNIRLVDDKSFPYINISKTEKWPKLRKTRKIYNNNDFNFGPFASVQSMEKVMIILEKGFLLRTCSDANFKNRERPCLKYQIKRCSAPCVGKINKRDYNHLVEQSKEFLVGKNSEIKKNLIKQMEKASNNQDYENAALFRDRIKALRTVTQEQYVSLKNKENFDLIGIFKKIDLVCIQVFFFRAGKNLGNKEFFFNDEAEKKLNDIFEEFIGVFYVNNQIPESIYINENINNLDLLEKALRKNKKSQVKIIHPKKGKKLELLNMVIENISHSLEKQMHKNLNNKLVYDEISKKLLLSKPPKIIEVYDNSHLNGSHPIGTMIVYDNHKFSREKYRKFNIKGEKDLIQDDYFMMKQVISRRFSFEDKKNEWKYNLPDLIIIDGGKGHYNLVENILKEKNIKNIDIISIAKGVKRNAGNETIFLKNRSVKLEKNDKVLYFLQRLRDEAHRFAINSQKYRRKLQIQNSVFDEISGIGAKAKKNLLSHFGSISGIKKAGIKDLENTPGIGKIMAKKIYDEFNR